jgi:FMN phosphatase YigB (HAD superfamily)
MGREDGLMANKVTNFAIVFDLDGTLVDTSSILRYVVGPERDLDRFHEEARLVKPITVIADLARTIHHVSPLHVVIMTARSDKHTSATVHWLDEHEIPYSDVFFRPDGDDRKDYVVKEEMFHRHIVPVYRPVLALDDNPAIISMWKRLGIPAIAVPGFYVDEDSDVKSVGKISA